MARINFRILKQINETKPEALLVLYNAMLDDLIERRKPRDPELFRWCMTQEVINARFDMIVEDFNLMAAEAFADYHAKRAKGAFMQDGQIAYPAAVPDDDAADDDEECDTDTTADADEE